MVQTHLTVRQEIVMNDFHVSFYSIQRRTAPSLSNIKILTEVLKLQRPKWGRNRTYMSAALNDLWHVKHRHHKQQQRG